jgi:hypothetical protein
MFTKKDLRWFYLAGTLLIAGFMLMALDPAINGFGIMTLSMAPPILLAGFAAAIPGITGSEIGLISWSQVRKTPLKFAVGGFVLVCSLVVYIVTLEPTASLWDCSEFIASAYKLQVPHTPGNPLLLVLGRIFSMLAFGDVTAVAASINAMSAGFSALTILILYFIIIDLGERANAASHTVALPVSAAAGSLCFAFSDTFWFSAVEAETYAASCFFFFLLVLLILNGNTLDGLPRKRMLVLIFYVGGLSFCIHPMCVLALTVLPLVWYLRKRHITLLNLVLATSAGVTIVLFINRVIAIGIFEFSFTLDRILVNNIGLPFYSGAFLFGILLILSFKVILKKFPLYSPHIYALIFLLAGFLPYLVLFIRSNHNPPIDESNPENLQLIKAYMNREGYPTRPLVYGPYFDAEVTDVSATNAVYYKDANDYKLSGHISEYKYERGRQTILPRIYSPDPDHVATYRQWTGLKEGEKPGFVDNMVFLFRYQLGHMYFRYLMFNYSGRSGDEQNSPWLAPWSTSEKHSLYENAAQNQYWMLPLIFGIAGMLFQLKRDARGFIGVAMAFLITGTLLVIYLNSTPNEPRERDYIYVASYGAFAIWIGLGFYWLTCMHSRLIFLTPLITAIPVMMAVQNFDDHDRSKRTFQVDNARNLLNSCAPDSILFTGGDNDTFPLWYVQEVEGFRTDVRVVVLSYLNTDWYINQLRNRYYESKPFRFTLSTDDYRQYGPNDALYVKGNIKHGIVASKFLALLHEQHPGLRVESMDGDYYHSLPSKELLVPAFGTDSSSLAAIKVTEKYLYKNTLAILDLLLNNPERPMYFNFTSMMQTGTDLEKYLVQEGPVFRLAPGSRGRIDTELSYQNMVSKANYHNLLKDNLYFSHEDHELRIIHPLRQAFNALASGLIEEGQDDKAAEVLVTSVKYFYRDHFKPSFANLQTANLFLKIGRKEEAERLVRSLYAYNEYRINNGRNGDAEQQLKHYAGEMLTELERP